MLTTNITEKVDFIFYASKRDLNVGSYRIWVYDLQRYLCEIGYRTVEISSINQISDYDCNIVIVSKEDARYIPLIREKFTGIIGAINPEKKTAKLADFSIVGSHEERLSLVSARPSFLFPLIEKMYEGQSPRKHKKKGTLVIGYHGNPMHLRRLSQGLGAAIDDFSEERELVFRIFVSKEVALPSSCLPKKAAVEVNTWSLDTIVENLSQIDVGVVMGVTNCFLPKFQLKRWGYYFSDYNIRFKNKSNSGRVFPFIQLGIPVIADLTPSNFHLFGGLSGGSLAFDKDSWLQALKTFEDPNHREKIASENLEIFRREYDPLKWAAALAFDMQSLYIKKEGLND